MLINNIKEFESIIFNSPNGFNEILKLENLKESIKNELFVIYNSQKNKQIWLTNEFKSLNEEIKIFDNEDFTFNTIYKNFLYRFDFIIDYLDQNNSKYDLSIIISNEFKKIEQYELKTRIYKKIVSLVFYLVINESLIDLLVSLIIFYFEEEIEDKTVVFEMQIFLRSLDNDILTEIQRKTTFANTLLNIE